MSQNPGPGYGQASPPDQPYGYPPQQPQTQPYGQPQTQPYGQQPQTQPYGQPPQQAPTQPYAYPAQQMPPQPYAYPPQQAPTQAYGQPVQGFAPTPTGAYGSTPITPAKRSPLLGTIALAVVVICGIVLSYCLWRVGGLVGSLAVNGTIDTSNQTQLQQAVVSELGGAWALLVNASALLGFAGWIMGIVAVATKRGRGLGVVTIILGVLAPIIAFIAMIVAIAPYLATS